MDIGAYRSYLKQLVIEAVKNSDGTNKGICEYLEAKKIPRFLTRHRSEKQRALNDARRAFDEHRYWPVEIVFTHLGLDRKELENLL